MSETTTATDTRQAGADPGGSAVLRTVTAPVAAVADLLPTSTVPVLLGATALAVGGVIDWPVAAAIGLGYYAVRRWR
jgi:hypothetical protein